jgi:hypothetical protein
MVDAEINFKNAAEIRSRLQLLETQVDEAVQRTAQFFILTGRSEIQKNLYPGHGYQTGNLRSSYQGEIIESSKCYAKIKLWTETTYAPPVEYGNGGRIAHFRPGIQVTITQANEYFNSEMEKVMQ